MTAHLKSINSQFYESLAQAVDLGTIIYEFVFIITSLEVQGDEKLLVIAEIPVDFRTL